MLAICIAEMVSEMGIKMKQYTYLLFVVVLALSFSGCINTDQAQIKENMLALQAVQSSADLADIAADEVNSELIINFNGEEIFAYRQTFSNKKLYDFLNRTHNLDINMQELIKQAVDNQVITVRGRTGETLSTYTSHLSINAAGRLYEQIFSVTLKTSWQKCKDTWLLVGLTVILDGQARTS